MRIRVRAVAAMVAAGAALLLLATPSGAATAVLNGSRFVEAAKGSPRLLALGEVLEWEATDPSGSYLLRRRASGRPAEFAVVKAVDALPPDIAGATVGYSVRALLGGSWSNEVSVAYPTTGRLGTSFTGSIPAEMPEARFSPNTATTPSPSASGEVLQWATSDPTGVYVIKRLLGGQSGYAVLKTTSAKPPAVAGTAVPYAVRGALGGTWSAPVTLTYPAGETPEEPPPAKAECALYASTSGSDTNPGTATAPFATVHRLAITLPAGATGCLVSGQTFEMGANSDLPAGAGHGTAGAPVHITSTEPARPAVITGSVAVLQSYVALEHLTFVWSLPKPWVCWNAEGNPISGHVISGPRSCTAGAPSPQDAVQVVLGGKGDVLAWDDITSNATNICVLLGNRGEGEVVAHSRIHGCGPTLRPAAEGFPVPNEEWGWHSHAIYDSSRRSLIANNYIYEASRDGVLLYGGGEGAVVEHNVIDHNGAGVWFGDDRNVTVRANIITNSGSPRNVSDFGIGAAAPGSGDSATGNCLGGNQAGDLQSSGFAASGNKLGVNPLYVNGAAHDYRLSPGSPCAGYGPDTALP